MNFKRKRMTTQGNSLSKHRAVGKSKQPHGSRTDRNRVDIAEF